jgi:ribosomal peptide maturation radical SAM protein 1
MTGTRPLLSIGPKPADAGWAGATPARPLRTALVNMPWARVDAPSIQCGLLASVARQHGHECEVHYLNLRLAAAIGGSRYEAIAELQSERLHMFGEWLFSYAAFGDVTPEQEYFREFPELAETWRGIAGTDLDDLVTFRRETLPAWLESCLDGIAWRRYDVVGFSSTFFQNTATLALGRMIKERAPEVTLVYGGANFDGEMGVEFQRHLPWLDYVVSGEGDVAFPALLHAIAAGSSEDIPGVSRRDSAGGSNPAGDSERLHDLDRLPVPDYQDYFHELARLDRHRVLAGTAVKLPLELSRGCWWGAKHHCTFCGLNALGMAYRAKTGDRALTELSELLRDYPAVHIEAVDNILDMKHLTTVCAELAGRRWDVSIFFEVKANLTREQLHTLQQAGIHRIQPGIESLSTNVLRLMRKGSTSLINIRLLKWARYYGIKLDWNILTGFPGEVDADYTDQARLIPQLVHLQPPAGCGRLWLERFSPYFTDSSLGMSNVRPRAVYRYLYPDRLDHSKIAYFFDYDTAEQVGRTAREALVTAVDRWCARWSTGERRPNLFYQRLPEKLTIIDSRWDEPRKAVLTGWRAAAYEACGDAPRTAASVRQELSTGSPAVTVEAVGSFLAGCCRAGVMAADEGKFLSLALPENPGW